jgi:regulator of replication initiation timing/energy-coupling factor transporter ATP-binding protein EcfA2
MVNFPVLNRLDISGYGLFPGSEATGAGLHVDFKPGLTLVIGANGLGKSTLVSIIYRVLSGPFDIPGVIGQVNLGNAALDATELDRAERASFAQRVSDGARNASARLTFKIGNDTVVVERRLSNLSLTAFEINGAGLDLTEQVFQAEIARIVGLWSFGDWILFLRHVMFYFEDRRALVWDASAQRQILRFLFLPAATARKWTEDSREILELDSRMRNLRAATTREERALATSEFKTQSAGDVRERLAELEGKQKADEERRDRLSDGIAELEARRQTARLRVMQAEQEREARFRELERARLISIGSRFPSSSETARYIISQLVTDKTCLVCGSVVPSVADEYTSRIDHRLCVVCSTDLSAAGDAFPAAAAADGHVEAVTTALASEDLELADSRRMLDEAKQDYNSHLAEIRQLEANIAERSSDIHDLVKRLPPAEAELHRQRTELAAMRARVGILREELDAKRRAFVIFIEEARREMSKQSEGVKRAFDEYAEGFTLELCRLVWSSRRDTLGQSGELIEFPAFVVEMTGSDFQMPVRRTGPEQVSESQREFIDLAFRMALMSACGAAGVGSLLIDAPESSLDAIFVLRATNVLSRFAHSGGGDNRLMVTSNLTEGQLLPELLKSAGTGADRRSRIVDLLSVAIPTAAVTKLKPEYEALRAKLLSDVQAET